MYRGLYRYMLLIYAFNSINFKGILYYYYYSRLVRWTLRMHLLIENVERSQVIDTSILT